MLILISALSGNNTSLSPSSNFFLLEKHVLYDNNSQHLLNSCCVPRAILSALLVLSHSRQQTYEVEYG